MCFQNRLKLCNLELFKTRRLQNALILMHAVINGAIHVDLNICVSFFHFSARGI